MAFTALGTRFALEPQARKLMFAARRRTRLERRQLLEGAVRRGWSWPGAERLGCKLGSRRHLQCFCWNSTTELRRVSEVAQAAADRGELRLVYQSAQTPRRRRPKALRSVTFPDGSVATSEQEVAAAWGPGCPGRQQRPRRRCRA